MPVSSNTLFHFTTAYATVESILTDFFRPSYCKEEFNLYGSPHLSYYPMITFCDLPLTLAKEHIGKYGNYALGMSKEWGKRNSMNPVLYLEADSNLAKDFANSYHDMLELVPMLTNLLLKTRETIVPINESDLIENNVYNLSYQTVNALRYVKNYEGTLKRKYGEIENYRFYDEREWRYLPAMNENGVANYMNKKEYEEWRGSEDSPKRLIDSIQVTFKVDDIRYLIVNDENDRLKLINFIHHSCPLTINDKVGANMLTSRILTVEQLNTDF